MIRIRQLRIPCGAGRDETMSRLEKKVRRILRLGPGQHPDIAIEKHSVDARRKPELYDVYTVLVSGLADEARILKKIDDPCVSACEDAVYAFRMTGDAPLRHRPVIVGAGPAGLFCGLLLAEHGYRPIILERGRRVEERAQDVARFWETGVLDPSSNVQFGEGGAGTFSDGKLNTLVNDREGRDRFILERFVRFGAPEDVLTEARPHIGTDRLRTVVANLRDRIIECGGEVRCGALCTELLLDGTGEDRRIRGILLEDGTAIEADCVVLAPGHSARDTFRMLGSIGVPMEPKDFAVGLRVAHPQDLIDSSQYGISGHEQIRRLGLVPASYKLTARCADGRGIYSFCMCPGGYIVNASSSPEATAVNGMSSYARDSGYANSAIVMTVSPADYGTGLMDGMRFQAELEEKAFALGRGAVPTETLGDFMRGLAETDSGQTEASDTGRDADAVKLRQVRGTCRTAPRHTLLPPDLSADFAEGMQIFDRKIRGFADPETLLAGVETRTSSPLRILRDRETYMSAVRGLYPCGEGAGYAGGIMSAAMDGMRCAESVAAAYYPVPDTAEIGKGDA